MNEDGTQSGLVVDYASEEAPFFRGFALQQRAFVPEHQLPCEQVTLAIVTQKDEVILGVQLPEIQVRHKFVLADLPPRAWAEPFAAEQATEPAHQLAWQEGREAVHMAAGGEVVEHMVSFILGHVLVDVRPRGQENEVARRRVWAKVMVQRAVQSQAARIERVRRVEFVAARGEFASAAVKGVVHVAEHLDAHTAAVVPANCPRLRLHVVDDLITQYSRTNVAVHELVQIEIIATAVDQRLQNREVATAATDDESTHRLALVLEQKPYLLKGVEENGLRGNVEKVILQTSNNQLVG
mmetsp:Transcript_48162/g.134456  ORF Transcript_48162/g.134456 Transcript_48162/m.134456 type:complete len:296 (+) Transcript_48162:703-1590(+)